MAWIQKIGKSWYTVWRVPGQTKKRKKSFGPGETGKHAARVFRNKVEATLVLSKAGAVEKKTTWARFMKDFTAYSKLKHAAATTRRYLEVVRHFEQLITPATVQAVTRRDAIRFRTLRGAQVKGKSLSFARRTLNYELEVMRAVFAYAMRDLQLIESNPFSRIEKLKEKDSREMRILEDEEIEACKEHFDKDSDFYPLFLFLLRTGVRIGEAHRVRRKNIDEVGRVVWVRSTKTETDSEDRFRSVPLTRGVAESLQMRIAQGYDDLIFGRRANKNYFYKKLKTNIRRLVRAGLLDRRKFLDESRVDPNLHAGPCVRFTVHDLRHTFASHFLNKGGDIKTLQHVLGHKRLATTERYLHLVRARNVISPIDY